MNRRKIPYVSDAFLDEFKTNFDEKYLIHYRNGDEKAIRNIFDEGEIILSNTYSFEYKSLIYESDDKEGYAKENVRRIRKSLGHLPTSVAEKESFWVAITNTYYLDYHLDQIKNIKEGKNKDSSIRSRTIFYHGKARSLLINSLSILWWIGYYLYDDKNKGNEYHLADYFLSTPYRGNAVPFLSSSNIGRYREVTLAVLEAIKELENDEGIIVNRYAYSESMKILNRLSGVRLIDMMTREEIKQVVRDNLLDARGIRFDKKV